MRTLLHYVIPFVKWQRTVFCRGNYVCSVLARRLMVDQGRGLIVNVSSPGGLRNALACDAIKAER